MASITPPFAANEIWFAFGAETRFGYPASNMAYAGVYTRNDLPEMAQNQNMRPDWVTGLRVPVGFTPGAQAPTGRVRVECLPAFGAFAASAFQVTANPAAAPFQFPTSLPSWTFAVGGKYSNTETPFMYVWTGAVVNGATLSWAEGEKVTCNFGWDNAYAWVQQNYDLDVAQTYLNVGEKPLMFHEGVFSDVGLQGIEAAYLIRSGRIRMRRTTHRAYGSGGLGASQLYGKRAARGPWNVKVLSQQIGADFALYTTDGFADGPNTGANAPKWLEMGHAGLRWIDSASVAKNYMQCDLYRVTPNTSRLNEARAEDVAMFGMDWLAADWQFSYTTSLQP